MFHRKQNSNDEHQAMKIHKAVHRMPLKKKQNSCLSKISML